ncbi:MAG: thymidylate synthase, partial [Opitutae bacterium]|nr:thymidylate synthase [Opitutae bacterium]
PPRMLIHGDQQEISDFRYEDFELVDYECHPAIKAPIAV